jgi:reactive intermediate/imine deaminase
VIITITLCVVSAITAFANTNDNNKDQHMKIISTKHAPQAIGPYSQAVKHSHTVYLSGQIGLDPKTMKLPYTFSAQANQVFKNLVAVITAAGGKPSDVVKLNIYLTDFSDYAELNKIMQGYFTEPFPARAAVGVASLPKDARIEVDGIMVIKQ